MSWECDPCHKIATGVSSHDRHFSGSYGRCETCARSAYCAHCQCPGEWAKARKERAKKSS